MNKPLSEAYRWVDERLGIRAVAAVLFDEPIPGGARWAYVFGSALLFVVVLQIITGTVLALTYVQSAETAHVSVEWVQKEMAGGSFIRGLHHWGSSMMIVLLGIHMLQTFFWGAYKKPREMVWIFGGLLMLLILGFSFTGYLLPWDQKAYFATMVGTNIASEVPVVGNFLKAVALGGSKLGTITLGRFFTVHTMILPGLTIFFIFLHIYAFRKAGAAGPFRQEETKLHNVELFYPKQLFYDTVFAVLIFAILATLAVTHPATLEPKANPADTVYTARPEWYFLPVFELAQMFEGELAIVGTVIIPGVLFSLLFLAPFLDRSIDRSPFKRWLASASMLAILAMLGTLFMIAKRNDGAFLSASEVQRFRSMKTDEVAKLSPEEKKKWNQADVRAQLEKQDAFAADFMKQKFVPYQVGAGATETIKVQIPPVPQQYAVCADCHGDLGGGGMEGPDLINIGADPRFNTPNKLEAAILDPDKYGIGNGEMTKDTTAKMTEAERRQLIEYLVSLAKKQ